MGLWMTQDFQHLLELADDAAYHDPFFLDTEDARRLKFYRVTVPVAAWLLAKWKRFGTAYADGKVSPEDFRDTKAQFDAVLNWVKDNLDTERVKAFDVRKFSFPPEHNFVSQGGQEYGTPAANHRSRRDVQNKKGSSAAGEGHPVFPRAGHPPG